MEDYDERALAERATAWLGNDAEELADLIEDIQEMFEDAIEHDEGSEDVRTACAELLARDGLTTLDRAQLGIWRAFMAIAGADADAIEHCRDARDWVNDLEIVAAKSGLSDPRLEQLRNDAEELRDQLPEETTLKPDPTIVRVEALLAAQRATRDQKTATTAAKGETNQTLMPSVLARVQVTRADAGPEITLEAKLQRNKDVARYKDDVLQMQAEDAQAADTVDAQPPQEITPKSGGHYMH